MNYDAVSVIENFNVDEDLIGKDIRRTIYNNVPIYQICINILTEKDFKIKTRRNDTKG